MIDPKMIPDEVVEAAMRVLARRGGTRAAIAAALNAWPDADVAEDDDWCAIRKGTITLPTGDA